MYRGILGTAVPNYQLSVPNYPMLAVKNQKQTIERPIVPTRAWAIQTPSKLWVRE